jgi:hypothetical protein
LTGRFFAPTTGFNKSYIGTLWNARHELADSEKRGFAQFFYLTISGHVESVISKIISSRLDSIIRLPFGILPPQEGSINGNPISCSVQPICDSLSNIILDLKAEVEVAPLNKLKSLYKRTFKRSLKDVIGEDRYRDLDALADLRNILAHGRDLHLEYSIDVDDAEIVTLDSNPLKKPIERLKKANILSMSVSDIDGMNWFDFLSVLYCDDALLYFYNAVKKIENELRELADNPFESFNLYIVPLPDLGF